MKLTFREATIDDKASCLEMIKDFYAIDQYPFDPDKVKHCFHELVENDQFGKFWLLKNNGQIIGYLILTFGFSFEYGGRDAFIDEFYLKKAFRGQGLGTQLLQELDHMALEAGINAIHLEVEKTNEAGNRLYFKSGYRRNNRSLLTKRLPK